MNDAEPDVPGPVFRPDEADPRKDPAVGDCWPLLPGDRSRPTAAALAANQQYSFGWRIGNALISYVAYLGQFFCPLGLAPCYPRRSVLPPWQVAAAALLLVSVTAVALRWRRQRPYLLVGWLWYVGMLVPVIGLVQFGGQAEADRFTYLPQIGLAIALAWTAADACRDLAAISPDLGRRRHVRLVVLVVLAWRQTSLLARQRDALDPHSGLHFAEHRGPQQPRHRFGGGGRIDEAMAHYRKAPGNRSRLRRGPQQPRHCFGEPRTDRRGDGALPEGAWKSSPTTPKPTTTSASLWRTADESTRRCAHFRKALEIKPDYADAQANLGNVLARRGRTNEAILCYERALQLKPDFASAHNGLGNALSDLGRADEAERQFQKALEIDPNFAEAHNSLGSILTRRGRVDEAAAEFRKAVELKPDFAEAHDNLGLTLNSLGRVDEAAAEFRRALQLKPDFAEAHGNLGGVLYLQDKLAEAMVHFQKHLELDPTSEMARRNFALAVGRFAALRRHWHTGVGGSIPIPTTPACSMPPLGNWPPGPTPRCATARRPSNWPLRRSI